MNRRLLSPLCALLLGSALLAQTTAAQTTAPKTLDSHQINADGSITFRAVAPGAKRVAVSLDLIAKPLTMAQASDGVWSVTTPPLAPEYYGYTYLVDGREELDPLNSDVRFNYVYLDNQVLVPGHPPQPWELTDEPHGRVDHIRFTTHVALNLPANQSAYEVYTPPGYDAHRKGGYPVLYLLHGWSDNQNAWTSIGRAGYILDTLIDQHKAVPMIVVMPLGYGNLDFVDHGFHVWTDPAKVNQNTDLFSQSLFTEVMPAVDNAYNIAPGRENHAISGLSMGGLETLVIGLNHTDQFAWVAAMSAALIDQTPHSLDQLLPALAGPDAAKQANLRLLWVSCGTGDPLIAPNRAFVAWAQAKGLHPMAVETTGRHVWLTWRDNLVQLAPLLFK